MEAKRAPEETPVDPQVIAVYKQGMAALRKIRVPFALIGGVALEAYGARRRTTDVDFMLFCAPRTWEEVVRRDALGGLFRDSEWQAQHPEAAGLVVRFRGGDVPVDFLRPRDEHEEGLRTRRRTGSIAGRRCMLLPPEDYILLKLKAQRDHDFADAIRIVRAHLDRLDYAYLRGWSIKLGVFEELQYVVVQAERTPSG